MPKNSPLSLFLSENNLNFELSGINLDEYVKHSNITLLNTFQTFSIENFKKYSIQRQSDVCKLYLILDLDRDVDLYTLFSYIELYKLEIGNLEFLNYNSTTLVLHYLENNLTLTKYKISSDVYQYVVELPGLGEYCPILPLRYTNLYVTLKVNNNIKFKLGVDYLYLEGEERKTFSNTNNFKYETIQMIEKKMDLNINDLIEFNLPKNKNIKKIIICVHSTKYFNPNYKSFFKNDIEPLEFAELCLVTDDFSKANITRFELYELKKNKNIRGLYIIPLCTVFGNGVCSFSKLSKATVRIKLNQQQLENNIITLCTINQNMELV
jgi:hypothetical protein